MSPKRIIGLFLLCVLAAGAAGAGPLDAPSGARILTDVRYGKAGEKALLMDLALPKATGKPSPAVVWIHGGGWRQGSKAPNVAAWLAGHGYAAASIEYRFSKEAVFPAQIHDCKAAIRFLRAHSKDYNIDPKRIGVWGASAGGHLAALLGTSGGVKALEGDCGSPGLSSRVQAVCDFFGPADLTVLEGISGIVPNPVSDLLGGPVREKPALAKLASPVTHVTRGDPPVFIVHGELDTLVPIRQSERFRDVLTKSGVDVKLLRVKNAGHGFNSSSEPSLDQIAREVLKFFDRMLKPH
ncbi:MAG: alpha/beta hydrolase [Armatimonadota bacterium]|nr:alpha/beta hydrolase [Armatimonadota bacterium]